jgi:hypothetical protein
MGMIENLLFKQTGELVFAHPLIHREKHHPQGYIHKIQNSQVDGALLTDLPLTEP